MAKKKVASKAEVVTGDSSTNKHKLNQVGSAEVDDFLHAFDQNKMGTCLKALESGEIVIVDMKSLAAKMSELQRYKDNHKSLQDALTESYQDIGTMMGASLKINELYEPIEKDLKPIFEKAGIDGKEEVGKIKLGKVLVKLIPTILKVQKKARKIFDEIDMPKLQSILDKYSLKETQEITDSNVRKLDEPTEQLQIDSPNPSNPPNSQYASSVGNSSPNNDESQK